MDSLVDEAVRLHAGPIDVDLVEVPDGAKAGAPRVDRAVSRSWLPEPAESFRARRHALELIEQGSLLGAWGAVRHLHDDEVERRWTQVVEWLSLLAASLPLPDECDLWLLKHPRMAVQAALRVGLALRAGDVPRAVHGTVAFFEAALWDHLRSQGNSHHTEKMWLELRLKPSDLLLQGRDRPFSEPQPGWFKFNVRMDPAIRIATEHLKRSCLAELGQAVGGVRDLRNDVAHNTPTHELMANAHRRMEEAGLWAKPPSLPRFLGQSLIAAEMADYGFEQSERLCADLFAEVRARLLAAAG